MKSAACSPLVHAPHAGPRMPFAVRSKSPDFGPESPTAVEWVRNTGPGSKWPKQVFGQGRCDQRPVGHWPRLRGAPLLPWSSAGLGACGMSSLTSGIGGGMVRRQEDRRTDVGQVNEDQLLAAAKTDCGRRLASISGENALTAVRDFQVWSRDNNVTVYEQGRVGDGWPSCIAARSPKPPANASRARQSHRQIRLLGPRAARPKGKSGNVTLPVTFRHRRQA